MNAPKEFIDLIYSTENQQNYIGMGNPNARILIIGREPAHDLNTDIGRDAFHQDHNSTAQTGRTCLRTNKLKAVVIHVDLSRIRNAYVLTETTMAPRRHGYGTKN